MSYREKLPLQFTVNRPSGRPEGMNKGIYSTRGPNGRFIQMRVLHEDRLRMQVAANLVGLTLTEYIMSVCKDISLQIIDECKKLGVDISEHEAEVTARNGT